MRAGPEDLGILFTLMGIFFVVTAVTLSFAYYALKAEAHPERHDPDAPSP